MTENKVNMYRIRMDFIKTFIYYNFNDLYYTLTDKLPKEFARLTIWHAAIPAVSVRNLDSPRDISLNPFVCANFTSSRLKSPSGPMSTTVLPPLLTSWIKWGLRLPWQCAI